MRPNPMTGGGSGSRSRVEADRSTGKRRWATQSDRFVITINIGDESLHFNKSRAIGPDDEADPGPCRQAPDGFDEVRS